METAANHIEDSLGIGMLVHHEVAAMVSSIALKANDRGVVIVGGSMKLRDSVSATKFDLYNERLHEDSDGSDSSNFREEKELQRHRDIYYEKLSKAEHFSYYAFDGRTGRLRWKSEGETSSDDRNAFDEDDVLEDIAYSKNAHYGFENDTEKSETSSTGSNWRKYRKSVLAHSTFVLPHSWST